jgi:hypothetical protein
LRSYASSSSELLSIRQQQPKLKMTAPQLHGGCRRMVLSCPTNFNNGQTSASDFINV